ncbi:MAG: DUF642 domain-containing protein [Verrucomicrobiota bacterium]|jgi:hypothetical protein
MSLGPKLVLALALILPIHPLHAGILVNGSFEAATNAATLDYISLNPGSTNIPGWTTTNAELTWDGAANGLTPVLTAAQGYDFLDLSGVHDTFPYGAVFQTMTTTIGQQYQVSFELGSDKYYDSYYTGTFIAPVVAVALNGVVVFSATNNFPTLYNYWQTWSFDFTASATSTTLRLTGANTAAQIAYIGLDNVMVTGGPLMILLSPPTVASGHAQIPFTLTSGTPSTFELLQSAQVNGPWVTNSSAVLTTNVPGVTYTFTAPTAGADGFYRVQSP